MAERLAIELALMIFCEAAETFVVSDYPSALALAQTSRIVYNHIRAIILRRVILTNHNARAIENLLLRSDSAALVLDSTLKANACQWKPPSWLFINLTNIRCLRGAEDLIDIAIGGLPTSARATLFKIHLWTSSLLTVSTENLTHISVYLTDVANDPEPFSPALQWVNSCSSLTHLGIELVSREDCEYNRFVESQQLMASLRTIFDAGGPRLREIAIRLCGEIYTTADNWAHYLNRFRDASAIYGWDQRVRIWRDRRNFECIEEDIEAGIVDAAAGIDVWSEALPLGVLV